jgi:glycosyltransferase involved in cell wall biosynthesis
MEITKPITTIIIPSKTEVFLKRTIEDVLEKATGNIEVLPVVDGYWPPENEIVRDPRVRYIHLEPSNKAQKRHGINRAVSECKGDYVMSVDAHVMFAKGFDEQLIKDHNPNWVQVPRRHRLDAENWCLQTQSDNRPPIDYEYIMFPPLVTNNNGGFKAIHGFKWDARTLAEWDIPIADTAEFQGSCWFMTKEWFQRMGFMQIEGYTGWGQESEELVFTTVKIGGRVVTNKNTWYAHLHKGEKYGRMYWMSRAENRESYKYSYNKWIIENNEFFISYIDRFPRMPGWPDDWKEQIRNLKKL